MHLVIGEENVSLFCVLAFTICVQCLSRRERERGWRTVHLLISSLFVAVRMYLFRSCMAYRVIRAVSALNRLARGLARMSRSALTKTTSILSLRFRSMASCSLRRRGNEQVREAGVFSTIAHHRRVPLSKHI
jgi:hypothetical protein